MKHIKRLWFDLASSLPLNMLYLFFVLIAAIFTDNSWFWRIIAAVSTISLCFVNFNYNYRDLEKHIMTRRIKERITEK